MNYEKEMTRYRSKVTRKRNRRGRRKTDLPNPPFFTIGWVLEVVFLMMMGAWLLMACIKR